MTRTLLLALSLLVSAAWVQAQAQYPQTGSSQTGATASGQTTVEGCLQHSEGNYTLTDKTGTTYQLKGDTSKLKAHVGHEVQITGATMSGETSTTTGTQNAGTQSSMMVESVKHISETCKSAKTNKY
jgi:hypothetical protein